MYYGERENGRYFLHPMNPDRHPERFEITAEQFFDRWRLQSPSSEPDIADAQSHMRDFQVF